MTLSRCLSCFCRLQTYALIITYILMLVSMGGVIVWAVVAALVYAAQLAKEKVDASGLPVGLMVDAANVVGGWLSGLGIMRAGGMGGATRALSLREKWELGMLGLKSVLKMELGLSMLKKLGALLDYMMLVAVTLACVSGAHLLGVMLLVVGVNQSIRCLVLSYLVVGTSVFVLLTMMFFSNATILTTFPYMFFIGVCLYAYALLVVWVFFNSLHTIEDECD